MGWTGFPVTDAVTDIQLYSFNRQFWDACRERAWSLGAEFWPRTTLIQDTEAASSYCKYAPGYTGVIDSIAFSGGQWVVTDSSKSWAVNRWYDFTGPDPASPRFYDLIVEYDELNPWGVIRTKILGNDTTTLTLENGPIDDANYAGQLPAVTLLTGKRYCIVRQNQTSHRSLHWNDRWPEWPNAQELATGIVGTSTPTTLTDVQQRWEVGQFVGKDLMTLVGGRLKRFPVTANTKNQLTFTNPGAAPDAGAAFAVIPTGAKWNYGRNRPAPWRWYGGADRFMVGMEADPRFYSHWPDHSILPTPVAAGQLLLMAPDDSGTICQPTLVDAFDNDVWSATTFDEDPLFCDVYDRPYSPDVYKSPRGLQGWLEGVSPEFIEKKSYDNLAAIPNFTTATWFHAARINSFVTTVSSAAAGFITFPAQTFPPEAIGGLVHYAILDENNEPTVYGFTYAPSTVNGAYGSLAGTLVSTTRIDLRGPTPGEAESFEYPPPQDYLNTWVGKRLVISIGWSRYFPREFRYLYAKTVFVAPDGAAPDEAHPGFYVTRPASTRYLQYNELGGAQDSDTPAFVVGELARYVGDNWADPTTGDSVQDGLDADTPYRDRLFTGVTPPEFGTATMGTAQSLRDIKKDWWTTGSSLAPLNHDGGTATGGTTLGLTDSTKTFDGIVGFVVKVEIAGVQYARTIATASGSSLTWAGALPSTAAGKNYVIQQPLAGDAGVLRTDSGTAGGGGTSSLSDGSKAASAFWAAGTGRWAGFVVEVDIGGTWYRRPIRTYDPATQTLAWDEPLPSSANGRPYRIREPKYELNRWKGRTLRLFLPGRTLDTPITHSDDDTVYFSSIAAQLADVALEDIPPGTSYHILEAQPGQVWKWSGASLGWVVPTGDDTRKPGVKFHADLTQNAPTVVRGFGRVHKRDYITRRLLNQLYDGINALAWTKLDGFWDSQAVSGVSENNFHGSDTVVNSDPLTLDHLKSEIIAQYNAHAPTADSLALPRAHDNLFGDGVGSAANSYMYAVLPNVKTVRIKHAADAYAYTSTDKYDVGEYGPGENPDDITGSMEFNAQGSNAFYRRWSKLATAPASFNSSEKIKVGQDDTCPTGWPSVAPGGGDPFWDHSSAGWSVAQVARPGGTSEAPIIIVRWDVAAGLSFTADQSTGAQPGAGASGLFPADL